MLRKLTLVEVLMVLDCSRSLWPDACLIASPAFAASGRKCVAYLLKSLQKAHDLVDAPGVVPPRLPTIGTRGLAKHSDIVMMARVRQASPYGGVGHDAHEVEGVRP